MEKAGRETLKEPAGAGAPGGFRFNRIVCADAREALAGLPEGCADLSFFSPPYFVGKSYERHLDFGDWKALIAEVVREHARVLRPGGFMAVNIGDVLCFADPRMPRFLAENAQGKRCALTSAEVRAAQAARPRASRRELAEALGVSEQTVQRRLEGNNARGGRQAPATKVKLTGAMLADCAEAAGLYLYDSRIWHKDPCWMSCRWHSASYRAVDEFEHLYVFWRPGPTEYDRSRLEPHEWARWGSRGVWRIRSVRRNGRHEAEFPEELAWRVIRLFSPAGGLVIDPFAGTGTTLRAARRLKRKWFGCDADEDCVRMARRRVAAPCPGELFG